MTGREGADVVRAVAEAMAQGDHFALGGKGGAPDLIRELDKRGFVVQAEPSS